MNRTGDYRGFPHGFFDRNDDSDDSIFYSPPRLVTHIDGPAVDAVGQLYHDRAISGRVLDLMGSWVPYFVDPPDHLTVLGMNIDELEANPIADKTVVCDLNRDPTLPFDDASFDDAVCVVSVDYLIHPLEVFAEIRRVLVPGGRFICTFSNRCFPTKAIRGWLRSDDRQRCELVAEYFRRTEGFDKADIDDLRQGSPGDPLFAVSARTTANATPAES